MMKSTRIIAVFCTAGLIITACGSAKAQDCRFEVNAGPDIDVCNGGSVSLDPVVNGVNRIVWRGGKGKFTPSRNSAKIEYTPSQDEAGKSIVLTLVADDSLHAECKKERDDVVIRVNTQPVAEAGEHVSVCAGQPVQLKGTIKSGLAKKVRWTTNGSGRFSHPDSLETTYQPSETDLMKGGCSVQLLAIPYGVCLPDSDALAVSVKKGPAVVLEGTAASEGGKPASLNASIKGDYVSLDWTSDSSGAFSKPGKADTEYTPSASDAEKGSVTAVLRVYVAGGCVIEKSCRIAISTTPK